MSGCANKYTATCHLDTFLRHCQPLAILRLYMFFAVTPLIDVQGDHLDWQWKLFQSSSGRFLSPSEVRIQVRDNINPRLPFQSVAVIDFL